MRARRPCAEHKKTTVADETIHPRSLPIFCDWDGMIFSFCYQKESKKVTEPVPDRILFVFFPKNRIPTVQMKIQRHEQLCTSDA